MAKREGKKNNLTRNQSYICLVHPARSADEEIEGEDGLGGREARCLAKRAHAQHQNGLAKREKKRVEESLHSQPKCLSNAQKERKEEKNRERRERKRECGREEERE